MKNLILISGKSGSGKDQLCDYMSNYILSVEKTVTHDFISMDIKFNCRKDMDSLARYLWDTANELERLVDLYPFAPYSVKTENPEYFKRVNSLINGLRIGPDNWTVNKTRLTRTILQIYGTEIFQNRVDVNYWDKLCKDRIEKTNTNFIIVTDIRFESNIEELSSSKDCKVFTIRIERDSVKKIEHPTETSLDNYKQWDYIVENNRGLSDLRNSAKVIIDDILKGI
jgi:hypothetical protein